MKLPSTFLFLGLLPLLATPLPAQEAKPAPPLKPGVAAIVDKVEISQADYERYLFERFGKRPLAQLIDRQLVEAAAKRYGIALDPVELQQVLADRQVQARQGRSEEQFAITLSDSGQSLELFLENLRRDVIQELTLDGLVHATRVASDERLARAFDAKYGKDGVKVEVRHILVMPHFLRAERIKAGAKPRDIDQKEMKLAALHLAEECHARLVAGEDFLTLVSEYSHDQVSVNNGGLLPTYRPGLYGQAFTQAVASLEEGQYSDVIESGAGHHIVQMAKRTVTVLEDVRASLIEEVLTAAPTWQEREEVLTGLRAAADIQIW
ncbi:MAG: peptidylprolyl isomerase [Planctomycetota bacterium]|jgi:parvulin-like peptidyl-prolyl isomerase